MEEKAPEMRVAHGLKKTHWNWRIRSHWYALQENKRMAGFRLISDLAALCFCFGYLPYFSQLASKSAPQLALRKAFPFHHQGKSQEWGIFLVFKFFLSPNFILLCLQSCLKDHRGNAEEYKEEKSSISGFSICSTWAP